MYNALREACENVPDHIKKDGWHGGDKPVFGDYHVYSDDGRGMGRQHIASVPADKHYFGSLSKFIALAHPKTVLELLDENEDLRRQLALEKHA